MTGESTTPLTSQIITPVVPSSPGKARSLPPQSGSRTPARRPLPLATLPPLPDDGSLIFGMGRLDAYGRIADRAVLRALNWPPGTRYRAEPTTDAVVLRPDSAGPITINSHHGLTIPAPQRHWSGLSAGQRVLLVADTQHQLLIIHTPAALRAMVARYHSWQTGGQA